jgi:hypothetical protein
MFIPEKHGIVRRKPFEIPERQERTRIRATKAMQTHPDSISRAGRVCPIDEEKAKDDKAGARHAVPLSGVVVNSIA